MLPDRTPTVSNPALVKRRSVALERVTMRPGAAKRGGVPARAGAERTVAWRVTPAVAAAAIMAAAPLAYAGAPDPRLPEPEPARATEVSRGAADAWLGSEPLAESIALAPEELAPRIAVSPTPAPSVAALEDGFVKLEGIKANPYAAPKTRPRIVRHATRVGERAAVAGFEPSKVSDVKPNPY